MEPVLERAARESDPDERSRLAGLAAINRVLHPNVELYVAKLEREIARSGLRGNEAVPKTHELTKVFDVLYKYTKKSE